MCSRDEWDGSSRVYCCVEHVNCFNIVNEYATLLVCIFKNVNFAEVFLRLLYAMFIIYTSRI